MKNWEEQWSEIEDIVEKTPFCPFKPEHEFDVFCDHYDPSPLERDKDYWIERVCRPCPIYEEWHYWMGPLPNYGSEGDGR